MYDESFRQVYRVQPKGRKCFFDLSHAKMIESNALMFRDVWASRPNARTLGPGVYNVYSLYQTYQTDVHNR